VLKSHSLTVDDFVYKVAMSKIPCFVVIYYDFEIIQKSLSCLIKVCEKLDLIVLENKSEHTESQIKPYILNLLKNEQILRYYLFEENISNNAFEVVLDSELPNFSMAQYLLITDGDLYINDEQWLTEEIMILEKNPDIFACAISISDCNLPIRTFREAIQWLPHPLRIYEDYIEAITGLHCVLLRNHEFKQYFKQIQEGRLFFLDQTLRQYGYEILKKKWVRTKHSLAIHLTWDRYNDLEHPYTQLKLSKSLEDTWMHNQYCSYQIYSKESAKTYLGSVQSLKRIMLRALIYQKVRIRQQLIMIFPKRWKIWMKRILNTRN
jgi:hypothetical protein